MRITAPALISLIVALASCSSPDTKDYGRALPAGATALVRISAEQYPDFRVLFEDTEGALDSLDQSLRYFRAPSSKTHFPYQTSDRLITHGDQVAGLLRLREILMTSHSPEQLATRVRASFDVYQSVGWDGKSGEVLFTGYCTPIYRGSLTRNATYNYPLYRRPADLVVDSEGKPLGRRTTGSAVVPYYTRAEIDNHDLCAGGELVYLADPFEAFSVHIQGSAVIRLEDGSDYPVGYAGKTDRQYESLGKAMIQRGLIPKNQMSLHALKEYFRTYPEHTDLLHVNPCYVFFAETDDTRPAGSLGVTVLADHSIATDKRVFPRGGPVIAETQVPQFEADGRLGSRPYTKLMFDQDTGGAIRSAGRADLYLGIGPQAEQRAGYTQHEGRLFYLFLAQR